jgi:hypothetical protein
VAPAVCSHTFTQERTFLRRHLTTIVIPGTGSHKELNDSSGWCHEHIVRVVSIMRINSSFTYQFNFITQLVHQIDTFWMFAASVTRACLEHVTPLLRSLSSLPVCLPVCHCYSTMRSTQCQNCERSSANRKMVQINCKTSDRPATENEAQHARRNVLEGDWLATYLFLSRAYHT